jgi:hypothetical protein
VLAANLFGTLVAALLFTFAPVLTPEFKSAMFEIAERIL